MNFTSTSKRANPLTVIIALALSLGVLWLAYDIIRSEEQHPIQEFLFGYEEEGFVFYPVSHRNSFFAIVGLVMVLLLVVYGMLVQQGKTARKLKEQNRMITLSNEKNYGQHPLCPAHTAISFAKRGECKGRFW